MTLGEYNALRGWGTPDNEDPNTEGYVVEYTDGGKANVEGYEGYVSWSPKEVFENSYKDSSTASARVQIEHDELQEKVVALEAFIGNPKFETVSSVQQMYLRNQIGHMKSYLKTLESRLYQFNNS